MFKRDLVLGQEYLAFLLLNLFDLFLTGYIFSHKGMEANGLAAFILREFGTNGPRAFAIYKFAMVVAVILICEVIATSSVPKARLVMLVGSVVYFGVVLYESWLIYENITLPLVQSDGLILTGNFLLKGLF